MRSWWWVEVPPETCRAFSRYKLCNVASCWIYEYIGILLGARPILHISRLKVNKQFPPHPIVSKAALPSPQQEPVQITAPCSVSNTPSMRPSEAGDTGWPLFRIGPHAFTKSVSSLQKQLLLIYTFKYKGTATILICQVVQMRSQLL
jgi:hypothetical protein